MIKCLRHHWDDFVDEAVTQLICLSISCWQWRFLLDFSIAYSQAIPSSTVVSYTTVVEAAVPCPSHLFHFTSFHALIYSFRLPFCRDLNDDDGGSNSAKLLLCCSALRPHFAAAATDAVVVVVVEDSRRRLVVP